MKYKVGDKVRVARTNNDNNAHLLGEMGKITDIDYFSEYPYETTITNVFRFAENELEPAEQTMTQQEVLKLAIDGAKVQCTCGEDDYDRDECHILFDRTIFLYSDGDGFYGRVAQVLKDGYMVTFNKDEGEVGYAEDKMKVVDSQ